MYQYVVKKWDNVWHEYVKIVSKPKNYAWSKIRENAHVLNLHFQKFGYKRYSLIDALFSTLKQEVISKTSRSTCTKYCSYNLPNTSVLLFFFMVLSFIWYLKDIHCIIHTVLDDGSLSSMYRSITTYLKV